MNVPFYIAKRYAFSKSKTKAINTITKISTIGILVSSMALFVVLSVFSGLKTFNLSFTNEIDPDLVIEPVHGKSISVTENEIQKLNNLKEILAYSFVVEERVVFNYGEKQLVANIKGIDSLYNKVTNIDKHILYGDWLLPNTNQVVLGQIISNNLSVGTYTDEHFLEVLAMKPGEGAFDSPEDAYNKFTLYPSGIYSLQNSDIDGKYIYADIHLAQELLEWNKNQFSKIEFKVANEFSENQAKKALVGIFGDKYQIKNRSELNDSLHKMLQTESIAIYLIFTLVIIVTLFSLAGALIMMILEKKENLKTLNDIGISIRNLKRIFLFQGMILSTFGAILGLLLGLGIVFLQYKFQFITISEQVPYPVEINFSNAIIVFLTIFILAFFASLLASTRINKKYLYT
ncbi:ABC transporter permease [Paenimyroides tangerinum]|uniref:ABC transporter permease n=1 Tax=Paenimyroides tangerinum TaxID=2488728 RepID=A0A3P3W941_9FLAO|nr:FtsX-like permease family protein [Paenimyroides tangerinum]RRJ91661.1 ABC transporter permease [Paenimyroides tangerinum]